MADSCPKCGRPAPMNRDTCLYCGATIDRTPEDNQALRCPRCQSWMSHETIDGLELDLCHSCGGTWYDSAELEQRIDRHRRGTGEPESDGSSGGWIEPRRAADAADVRYLPCPRCHKPMVRQNFGRKSGVIIDRCGHHGIFLDAGEFEQIAEFERSGGRIQAQQEELESLKARSREVRRDAAAAARRHRRAVSAIYLFWP